MSLIAGIENFYAPDGCVTISPKKFLVPQCRENFVGGPFCAAFQKISGSQKFMDKRGGGIIQSFRRNFSVSQCRQVS